MNLEEALERVAHLEESVTQLYEEKTALWRQMLNARNPESLKRASFERVRRLAMASFLTVKRIYEQSEHTFSDGSTQLGPKRCVGYEVSMAHLKRVFKKLKDLWEFLSQESWSLSDLFPEPKPKEPKIKESTPCKFCSGPIRWAQDILSRGWIPHSLNGERHRCRQHQRTLVPF